MSKYTLTQISTENDPTLLRTLKRLLNETNFYSSNPLPVNNEMDAETLRRAYEVSTLYNYGDEYGSVGINTFSGLVKKYPFTILTNGRRDVPEWILKISRNTNSIALSSESFDMEIFLNLCKENFRIYIAQGNGWEENFRRFVNFLFGDITDRRWASYLLATAMHEGRAAADHWKATWNPVSESGGEGQSYGALETVVNWSGQAINASGNVITPQNHGQRIQRRYYGRGYIQITHQENYRAMDEAFILHPAKTNLNQSEYSNKMGEYFLWEKAEFGLLKRRRKSSFKV